MKTPQSVFLAFYLFLWSSFYHHNLDKKQQCTDEQHFDVMQAAEEVEDTAQFKCQTCIGKINLQRSQKSEQV